MAEWKKVLVSGSNIEVNQITATGNTDIQGTLSLPDFSDVSASLAAAVAGTATAGDGIFVTGNIVSVDSGSLIQEATDDSAYNVLFSNNTTPFAKDNPTSHFSYNPSSNLLAVSGALELGTSANEAGSEIIFNVKSNSVAKAASWENFGNVWADIQLDSSKNILFRQNPDGVLTNTKDFKFQSSGSDAAGIQDRLTIDGNGGGITIGDVSAATSTERTALVIDATGNVQSLELGDAVTTDSGSLTVLSSSYAGSVNYGDIIGTPTLDNYVQWHMAGDADTQAVGSNEWVHFVGGASITGAGTEANPYLMEITPATASYVLNAVSASHVAPAYDTVSVSDATISLTDMGGATDQITVNNVVNSDSASLAAEVTVTADNSTNANFYITTAKNVGGQPVYAHSALAINPSTKVVSANTGELHFEATSFTGSFKGDLAGTADIASAVDVTAATANADYRITMVDNTGTSGETLYVDSGLTYNPSTDSLTVSGDLIVNGTTTNINTTNLDIEDAYILLRSGSGTIGDSGIIFGGSTGTAQQGSLMFWDASYPSTTNDGRLAIKNEVASDVTGNQTADYYVAGVFEGTEAAAATAQADHAGNIRIDSGDIYIYV